jgi:hypothetical protein
VLVVETNAYAGNFERELTAWATGVVGECGVGDAEAVEFIEAADAMGYETRDEDLGADVSPFNELMELIIDEGDDVSCMRPCTMSKNANGEYLNVEMFMFRAPSDKDLNFIVHRVNLFPEYWRAASHCEPVKILGVKLLKRETVVLDSELWGESYVVQ